MFDEKGSVMVHAVKQKSRAERRKARSNRERIPTVSRQSSRAMSDMDFEGMRIQYGSRMPQRERAAAENGTAVVQSDELIVSNIEFFNDQGEIDWDWWAPGGGRVADSVRENQTLEAGTIIDRYGSPYGTYTSPEGISYEQRALPYFENPNAYHKYRVVKPISGVTISEIAPAFYQNGGGTQYELPYSVHKLINGGFLEEIL